MLIKTVLEMTDSSLGWNYFLPIDAEIALDFIAGDDRRVICTAGKKVTFHCALMPDGRGNYVIFLNKARREKLGWVVGQTVEISLEKDNTPYGMPMSAELAEVLSQEQEGSALFEHLTPDKQRTLIHWTDNVKNPDIRIRRALVMVNHLLSQKGKIDFKLLGEEMKEENQRSKLR